MTIHLIYKYEKLRKDRDFKKTNMLWNYSHINHPKRIGYLIDYISKANPQTYKEWETYFHQNIADKDKIQQLAVEFQDFVLKNNSTPIYANKPFSFFVNSVECRLIYETWLGYIAEATAMKEIKKMFPNVDVKKTSKENDNKYAVDYILAYQNTDICGIQLKSIYYKTNNSPILMQTKAMNLKKNKKFTEEYNIPVITCFYERVFVNNNTIKIKLIKDFTKELEKLF